MPLDDLLLNPKTLVQLKSFIKNPSHGLLFSGPRGSGLNFMARNLAAQLLRVDMAKLGDNPYFLMVEVPKDKKEIPIEAIRDVIHKLALRVPSGDNVNRVIMIKDAHLLSHPAQNTLLKILEEPPAGTVFILTSESSSQLAATIISRAQKIAVHPVDLETALDYYKGSFSEPDIKVAWQLSQGSAGLLHALLDQSSDHPLKLAVESAKQIVGQSTYERLITFDALAKSSEELQITLDALNRVIAALHHSGLQKDKHQPKLLQARKLLAQAQTDLTANVSTKLVATDLALRLPKLF